MTPWSQGAGKPMSRRGIALGTLVAVVAAAGGWGSGAMGAWGQQHRGHPTSPSSPAAIPRGGPGQAPAPSAQPHQGHGTPEGWKFTLPKGGDPARGRGAFVKFECFFCHEVKGESFPAPDPGKVGPELSFMAGLHPPEYFAEAIINPDAVIDSGRGYEAPDGSSKMPSFNEDMTVRELVDLVAYLVNLKPPAAAAPAPTPTQPASGGHGQH